MYLFPEQHRNHVKLTLYCDDLKFRPTKQNVNNNDNNNVNHNINNFSDRC